MNIYLWIPVQKPIEFVSSWYGIITANNNKNNNNKILNTKYIVHHGTRHEKEKETCIMLCEHTNMWAVLSLGSIHKYNDWTQIHMNINVFTYLLHFYTYIYIIYDILSTV